MQPRPSLDDVRRTARDSFGWPQLRPGQAEAIEAVLSGRDTLVVMPTGAGKSACYQIPALLLDGPTAVVSPLIALQRDQVLDLVEHGAFAANSSRRAHDLCADWQSVAAGDVEFVFLTPEQLSKPETQQRLIQIGVSLLCVDEAHCVSSWGHDFRPDYLRIGAAIDALGHPPVVALTATAAPPVREEIVSRLRLHDVEPVVRGFDRPNLFLAVDQHRSDEAKRAAVVLRAAAEAKPGMVYAATRKDSEFYARELSDLGLRAAAYHAGLRAHTREQVHQRWLSGELDVVVATTAFGMGIDKPDVRFVLHADVPESLDAYYQEIGRAGRDGAAALAMLHYRPEDLGLRRFFAAGSVDRTVLQRVVTLVAMHPAGAVDSTELRRAARLSPGRLTAVVNLLEAAGAVQLSDAGAVSPVPGGPSPEEAAAAAVDLAAARERLEQSRVEMVRGYAETAGCRRQLLLGYFGEDYPQFCDTCDTCRSGAAAEGPPDRRSEAAYRVNDRVAHRAWGPGVVMRLEPDRVTVLFETEGYKTLALDAVAAGDLLVPA